MDILDRLALIQVLLDHLRDLVLHGAHRQPELLLLLQPDFSPFLLLLELLLLLVITLKVCQVLVLLQSRLVSFLLRTLRTLVVVWITLGANTTFGHFLFVHLLFIQILPAVIVSHDRIQFLVFFNLMGFLTLSSFLPEQSFL